MYRGREGDNWGDFNARTGLEGEWTWGEQREDERRRSKNEIVNTEGKRLLEILGE